MIPAFDEFLAMWGAMSCDPEFESLALAIKDGLKLLQKYYDCMGDSVVLPLCTSATMTY
jgi:hypothetical protein